MKKVFVTGGSGMVGSRFIELCKDKYEIVSPGQPDFDLTNPDNVKEWIEKTKPDVVIHFAAYTNVSEAENQRNDKNGDAWKVNVGGTINLLKVIDQTNTHFIHISTDYVFSGSKENPGPYPESALPESDSNKITWYGFTKAEAERVVNSSLSDRATILRLIYPVRAKFTEKLDYLRKPLSLFDQGKLYPLFSDQQVTITFIDEASLVLEKIIDEGVDGVFHAATPDTSSPFELVSYLIEKARGKTGVVKESSLDEFIKSSGSSPVRYPKFGGLKVEETERRLGIAFSPWKKVIDTLISQKIS